MEQEIFIKKLGKRITKVREDKKLTQSELARLMKLPRQNIYRLETGTVNPKAHTIYELARVMKVDVGELMKV
ncbi:MAG: helix-turn-helix transcriptional regulator [Bacteroidia bacterium]|nr:helix-turn-helix transcriptional regulator [Bacteroidia bacterium]